MLTLLAAEPTTLQVVWYCLIAVLWIGYLVLEGYDYGVAMLLPFLGKNEKERRVIVNTIGPLWDGNEVWLLTAGGAMFAAFPGWYSTLFSGLYVPLLLVLLGLIVRGVSFDVEAGSVTALVGESGSGKSTVAQSVIGLLAANGRVAGGSIRLNERTDGVTELDLAMASFMDEAAKAAGAKD